MDGLGTKIRPKIYLTYSENEWRLIDQRIVDLGKSDFHSFLRSNISRLESIIQEEQSRVCLMAGIKECRQHYLSMEAHAILTKICMQLNLPASCVVSRILLDPLLG